MVAEKILKPAKASSSELAFYSGESRTATEIRVVDMFLVGVSVEEDTKVTILFAFETAHIPFS